VSVGAPKKGVPGGPSAAVPSETLTCRYCGAAVSVPAPPEGRPARLSEKIIDPFWALEALRAEQQHELVLLKQKEKLRADAEGKKGAVSGESLWDGPFIAFVAIAGAVAVIVALAMVFL